MSNLPKDQEQHGLGPPAAGPCTTIGEFVEWCLSPGRVVSLRTAISASLQAWGERMEAYGRRTLAEGNATPEEAPSEFSPVAKQDSVSEALTGKEGLGVPTREAPEPGGTLAGQMGREFPDDSFGQLAQTVVANAEFAMAHWDEHPHTYWLRNLRLIGIKALARAHEQPRRAPDSPSDSAPLEGLRCHICGKPATCIGRYDNMESEEPACDECCGHGCEDGHCERIAEEPPAVPATETKP